VRYSSTSSGRSNKPAGVSAYDVRTGKPGEREHDTRPWATNESSRSVSTFALSDGNPDRNRENDRGPCIRSRSTSVAHRPLIAASATSTGQSADGRSQVTVW
jgi:hypothetical protein